MERIKQTTLELEQSEDVLDKNESLIADTETNSEVTDSVTRNTPLFEEEEEEETNVIWVNINQVIPNPMNPRKNNAIATEQMQEIIMKRGWEEPLTVYQQGKMYVLLAGHRRLYAARQVGVKKLPLFVVEKPLNEQEEIERIASLQSGRVDWTPFEWAKFTYDRWIAWGRPAVSKFAKQINLGVGSVKQYINVLDNFPRTEIEADLQSKSLTISSLDALVKWLKSLRQHKPELVESMGEDLIRKIMLQKIINNKVNRDELRNIEYAKLASQAEVQEFLINEDMSLNAQLGYLGIQKKYKDFNGHLISIGLMEKRLPDINPETDHQREMAVKALEELQEQIKQRMDELKSL